MSQQDCIFCKIAAGQIPCLKVFENKSVLAFLDINPISEGHTLVIPKVHYERIDLCSPTVLTEVALTLPAIAAAVKQGMNVSAYNILCNNGAESGQLVKHIHFHIIPRRPGDKVFTQWPAFQYPAGKAEEVLKKIAPLIH